MSLDAKRDGALPAWRGWLCALATWVALAATAVLIPPLQSPDEAGHLARAAMLAEGKWFMHAPAGKDSGSEFDANLVRFATEGTPIFADPDPSSRQAQRRELAALKWGGAPVFVEASAMSYYMPLPYLPQALGLSLGRALDLSILQSYWLARVASWSACALLLLLAWRAMPLNPLVVGLLLMPMSVFQMASPTLDGVVGCLGVWVLAVLCRAWRDRAWLTTPRALLWVCAIATLAAARTNLLPLLLLPFALAWRHGRARDAWLGGAAAVAALGWVLSALAYTRDTRIPRAHGSSELLAYYARQPLDFLQVVWASIRHPELGAGYAETFIGRLGWLDAPLPLGAHGWLWWGLGLCTCLSLVLSPGTGERRSSDFALRASLVLAALASVLLTFLALLVTWTAQHPATHVEGIQGRYFLVPALLLACALSGTAPARCWRRRVGGLPVAALAVAAFAALSGWATFSALAARYHFPF